MICLMPAEFFNLALAFSPKSCTALLRISSSFEREVLHKSILLMDGKRQQVGI